MGPEPTGTGGWDEARILMGKILESVGMTEDTWTGGEAQGEGSSEAAGRARTPDLGHPDALYG